MADRVTQVIPEVLIFPTGEAIRVTQEVPEATIVPSNQLSRITQESFETVMIPNAIVRVTQVVWEVISTQLSSNPRLRAGTPTVGIQAGTPRLGIAAGSARRQSA
jgi:hypothetical protein